MVTSGGWGLWSRRGGQAGCGWRCGAKAASHSGGQEFDCMSLIAGLWRSSLGKKYIMAISGCLLFVFVMGHLIGNLQIFLGPDVINAYGHFLQSNPEILWPVRIGLLALVALHIASAVQMSIENKTARPVGYVNNPSPVAASYASRTMLLSGLIVAGFVLYHLLHYTATVQAINLTGQDFAHFLDDKGRHDVYRMMVTGFSHPAVSGFYVLAIGLLCLHLSHGVEAMFQSVGWTFGCCPAFPKRLARWSAWLIFLGYVSIPLAVLLGYGKEVVK
jgi:succinate dehydrogenase / fumarate reductase cytochrome b subunit